jgi:formate dehydrogenase gamma subunit
MFLTGLAIFIEPSVSQALGSTTRWLHQISAVVFVVAPLIYLLTNRQATGQGLKEAFTWGKNDIDWLIAMPRYYYLREEDVLPPQGRLNTLQKLWWLLVIFLVPVSIISGSLMWAFGTSVIAECAAVFHDLTFILIGCMFMLHVYISVVNPLVTGGRNESWQAMTTGKVSAHYARSYHRNWYKAINRKQ